MKTSIALALALCLASFGLPAQEGLPGEQVPPGTGETIILVPVTPPPGADVFIRLDADGDGFISQEEARQENIAEKFGEVDSDGDGRISPTEHEAYAVHPDALPKGLPPDEDGGMGGGAPGGGQPELDQLLPPGPAPGREEI